MPRLTARNSCCCCKHHPTARQPTLPDKWYTAYVYYSDQINNTPECQCCIDVQLLHMPHGHRTLYCQGNTTNYCPPAAHTVGHCGTVAGCHYKHNEPVRPRRLPQTHSMHDNGNNTIEAVLLAACRNRHNQSICRIAKVGVTACSNSGAMT
jgi:hypothetical protein